MGEYLYRYARILRTETAGLAALAVLMFVWGIGHNGARVRIAFYTLGCKVNQSETEAFVALFRERI